MELYADGANMGKIREYAKVDYVQGFTSNPSLAKKEGVTNYRYFIENATAASGGKPISFEVLSEDKDKIITQANVISSLGENVYVKIPIMSSTGDVNCDVINILSERGIKVNVTAITNVPLTVSAMTALSPETPAIISIFSGRIADTGRSPHYYFDAARLVSPLHKLLWASTRAVSDYYECRLSKADIITMPYDLIYKMKQYEGMNLDYLSMITSKMFIDDAASCGYTL